MYIKVMLFSKHISEHKKRIFSGIFLFIFGFKLVFLFGITSLAFIISMGLIIELWFLYFKYPEKSITIYIPIIGLLYASTPIIVVLHSKILFILAGIIAITMDTAGYFFGKKFGKHYLCPNISPKKTVEGVVLGIASTFLIIMFVYFMTFFTIIENNISFHLIAQMISHHMAHLLIQTGFFLSFYLLCAYYIKYTQYLLCPIILSALLLIGNIFLSISYGTTLLASHFISTVIYILCIASLYGDLIVSKFKRKYGFKDTTTLFPGFGGMWDRFDSWLGACLCLIIMQYSISKIFY